MAPTADAASKAAGVVAMLAASGLALAALVAAKRGTASGEATGARDSHGDDAWGATIRKDTTPDSAPPATGIEWVDGVNGYWNGGLRTAYSRRRGRFW